MYDVSAQGFDEHMINVHHYYYYYCSCHDVLINDKMSQPRAAAKSLYIYS